MRRPGMLVLAIVLSAIAVVAVRSSGVAQAPTENESVDIHSFDASFGNLLVDQFAGPWEPADAIGDSAGIIHLVTVTRGREGAGVYYVQIENGRVNEVTLLSSGSGSAHQPSIAAPGNAIQVVWQENQTGVNQIYTRVHDRGQWEAPLLVSDVHQPAIDPTIHMENGSETIIEWTSPIDSGNLRIRCRWQDTGCLEISTSMEESQAVVAGEPTATISARTIGFLYGDDVWSIREDATGLRRLTSVGNVSSFAWSPDGTRIAQIRYDRYMRGDVYVMNADGTNVQQLTRGVNASRWVIAWRDTRIAFLRDTDVYANTRIAYVNVNDPSSTIVDVTPDIKNYGYGFTNIGRPSMQWSHDGQHIAVDHGSVIGIADVTTGAFHPVEVMHPSWHPDSATLVHSPDMDRVELLAISSYQGALLRRMAANHAVYSVDGEKIAVSSTSLTKMDPDGSNLRTLSFYDATEPSWADNNDHIVYATWSFPYNNPFGEYTGLRVVGADGTGDRWLAGASTRSPLWQPQTYSVAGVIVDQVGRPLPGVTVSADNDASTVTDNQGRFELTNLGRGSYRLIPSKLGYTFAPSYLIVSVPSDDEIRFRSSDRPPVVLVHGFNGFDKSCNNADPDSYFKEIDELLFEAGYYYQFVSLTSSLCGTPKLDDNVQPLIEAIDLAKQATGQPKVILIAHSMGGLVSRAYVEGSRYRNDVDSVFTFGSPHKGLSLFALSYLLNRGFTSDWCSIQPAACDMSEAGMALFNQEHQRPPDVLYHLVTGNPSFSVRTVVGKAMDALIEGPDDGLVSVASGLGASAASILLTNEAHSKLFGDDYYFIHEEGGSSATEGFLSCLKPILIDQTASECSPAASADQDFFVSHTPVTTGVVAGNSIVTAPVAVDGSPTFFFGSWDHVGASLSLIAPDGQRIDGAYAISHPEQVFHEVTELNSSFVITTPSPGFWTMELKAGDHPEDSAGYVLFAAFANQRSLSILTDRLWYSPDATIILTGTLQPTVVDVQLHAVLVYPDGNRSDVTLATGQNGSYHAAVPVRVDAPSGYISIVLEAHGSTEAGLPFRLGDESTIQVASTRFSLAGAGHSDRIEDGGDAEYNDLIVHLAMNAEEYGFTRVTADLVDLMGNPIAHGMGEGELYAGIGTIALRFRGDQIYRSGISGPYVVTNVLVTDITNTTLAVQEASTVHTTQAYDYKRFHRSRIFLPLVRS